MKLTQFILFFTTLLIFTTCKKSEEVWTAPASETLETIEPSGEENYLQLDSDYIFDQSKLPTFELNLPPSALARIDADPTAEEYVVGNLTFEGETVSSVGIRYKGSIGAFVGCVSGNNWADPSGYKTCTKLSMKVKVNWEDSDRKFYGLKKLQFHSQNLDPSQMRDRLAYWLFRQMGIPAPRSIHARLLINGTYVGLFALVEQIDGRFTKYHFEDGDGNLYKEVWPLSSNGQAQAEQTYLQHLKTNEDENPSAALIRNFAEAIAQASDSEAKEVVANWMEVDQIIAYAVVDRMIRVDDGPFHWYCGGGTCTNHNYYWYEEPTTQKLHLIPWDMDNAFENIISNQNPVTPIADDWGAITNDCQVFRYGALQLEQRSAACDPLTAAWASFAEEYQQTREAFKVGPFSEPKLTELLDDWSAQIRAATIEAQNTHGDALSLSDWENALAELKKQLTHARNN